MKKTFYFVSTFIAFLLIGCMVGNLKIKPLGYISVDPYAKPLPSIINKTLYIYLAEDVKDSLSMEGAGLKPMKVTSFRKSASDGLKKVFQKNFMNVTIADKIHETEPTLVIYRIRPFWSRTGSYTSMVPNGQGGLRPSTSYFISAAFQFESTLFVNTKKIANVDGESVSEKQLEQMNLTQSTHVVFQDGLRVTVEMIEKILMMDETVEKIK